MSEEQYKKLNDYLNGCFLNLQKENPIFIDNLRILSYASDVIINSFNGYTISHEHKSNDLTIEDVILLAREIIEKIDVRYLEYFDSCISNGILDFGDDNDYRSQYNYIGSQKQKLIHCKREYNYGDVGVLVHEFMHSTNIHDKHTYNAELLTEFISIFFQEYTKRYLIEQKDVSIEEINSNIRIMDFLKTNRKFNNYCLVLLAYDKLGNITPNTPKDMKEILKIGDESFEKECLSILDKIEQTEKNTFSNEDIYKKMVTHFNMDYKYIVGTLLAYYALDYCKLEDIVKLNQKINTDEYIDMSIEEILETIGIELNYHVLHEAIECIKKNIYNYQVIK